MCVPDFGHVRPSLRNVLLASAVLMAGCGGGGTPPSGGSTASSGGAEVGAGSSSGSNSPQPGTAGGEQPSVAFVTNQIADFWKIAEAGCKDAQKDFDIQVEVRMPPQATAVEQKRIVEDLLTSGIDAIAISPLDADNQIEWLNGIAAKVPLITQDSDAPQSNRLAYIGMDNYAAGRMCGQLVRQALPEGGNVMLHIGRVEQDNSKYRRQGVIDELLGRDRDAAFYQSQSDAWDPMEGAIEGGGYTILGTILDGGERAVAQTKAEDVINTYPGLNAMVGLFEYNPVACYQALSKAGKLGQIKLIGFDENDITLQAIKDGECTGTVVQDPYQYGYESVRVLKEILAGDQSSIPESKFIDIPPRKITQENVDEYWADLKAKKGG